MILAHYDPTDGTILGFYDPAIHKSIPTPNVEIEPADHAAHLDGERRCVDLGATPKAIAIWVRPVAAARAVALTSWSAAINDARQEIAGASEPTKLAEYADKAMIAEQILSNSASQDMIDEAASEATRLGLADANAAATSWLQMAARLRAARSEINGIRDVHVAAISSASDAEAVDVALTAAKDVLATVVASYAN